MMKHVGLKLGRIDSSGGGAQTVSRRDRRREGDERWRKTSVMKWKKRVLEGTMCALPLLCVFLCVCVCEPLSLWVLRVRLLSQARLFSISLSPPPLTLSFFFVCLSLTPSLYPPILSHQGLLSSGPICRSPSANLIGDRLSLAWHGDELPNPFSPPARGSLPSALVQYCALTQQLQPQRQARRRIQRSVRDNRSEIKRTHYFLSWWV